MPAVLFDATGAEAVPDTIEAAIGFGVPLVLATSGAEWAAHALVRAAATQIPVVIAPNLARGHALMMQLARLIGAGGVEGAQLSVVDRHPPTKKDAPSATALRLAGACGTDRIVSLRAGQPVADHQLVLKWRGETVEITHRVSSMEAPVHGALAALEQAARLCAPGLYSLESPEMSGRKEGCVA